MSKKTIASPPRILLAEDNIEMLTLLAGALRSVGYDVINCHSGFDLLNNIEFHLIKETREIGLIISDSRARDFTGLEALEALNKYENPPPLIVITAFGDQDAYEEAKRLGASAIFEIPFDIDTLVARVRELMPHE